MAVRNLPEADQEELRVALVMNGGVSLAVWMGGVTTEIDRLRRRRGVYGELLDLTSSRPRVDVISGASAGGLNGAFLATAIAHHRPLEGLYELWIDKGAFGELMRSPFERDIPSLLKGDEFFLPSLREAFDIVAGKGPVSADPDDCVSLHMTTAVLQGISSGLADDFGNVIPDTTHLGLFAFRRDGGRDDWDHRTDAERDERLSRLALAARSCASFPVAFEASFLPVHESLDGRPDMAPHVNFATSRFAVDGGALLNKPFGPALDAIFDQPAGRQVRRVLLYVCPDPGDPEGEVPERFDRDRPGMVKTVVDSVLSMPRTESIAAELRDIRVHNDRVMAFRRTRDRLLGLDLEQVAPGLWPAYTTARAEASVAHILRELDTGVYRAGEAAGTWDRARARDALLTVRGEYMPPGFPAPGASPTAGRWAWGINPITNMSMAVLDLLARALAVAPFDAPELRAALREARTEVHDVRGELRRIRFADHEFWQRQAPAAREASASAGAGGPVAWARRAFEEWEAAVEATSGNPFERLAALARRVAAVVVEHRATLLAVAARAPGDLGDAIRRGTESLAPATLPAGGEPVDVTLRRLLALEVALTVFDSSAPSHDQAVELMMISGNAPNAFDSRRTPKQKLAGVQLGHFGAFYKAAWRANDWMFGRLDAAHRLALVLLRPARLRQLGFTAAEALDAIAAVASGAVPGHEEAPDAQRWLADADAGALDRTLAAAELAFLDRPAEPVPPSLPECARAVARRIQLDAVAAELPRIRLAMKLDDAAGALETSSATFRTLYDEAPPPLGPERAAGLFVRCGVGGEKVLEDAGSNLFTNTVTTAAAVAVTAGSGVRSSLGPFRFVLGVLRTFVMALYFLAQSAIRGTRSSFAVTTVLLGLGAVLVTLSLVDATAPPRGLVLLGWALVAAGLVLAWFRSGTPVAALVLVLATAAAFAAPYVFIGAPDAPGEEWRRTARPALAATALVVVPLVAGAIVRRVEGYRGKR